MAQYHPLSPHSPEDSFPLFPAPCALPSLLAIVYVHFDDNAGPEIVFQTPTEVLDAETFKCVKHYLIAYYEGFEDELVKICLTKYNIIGYTIRLKNEKKYKRNVFRFNMCFLTGRNPTDPTAGVNDRQPPPEADLGVTGDCLYEPLVKKLAQYLKELEVEESVLSDVEETTNREKLEKAMNQVYTDLRTKGGCQVQITPRTGIFLKITALPSEPSEVTTESPPAGAIGRHTCDRVKDSDVPMLTKPIKYQGHQDHHPATSSHSQQLSNPIHPNPVFYLNTPEGSNHGNHFPRPPPAPQSRPPVHVPQLLSSLSNNHYNLDDQDGPFPIFLDEKIPFDVTSRQLLPYFNGLLHVSKIAELSAVDITLVHRVVKNLAFYGLVTLLPMFQYCNRYALTGKMQKLYESPQLLRQCQLFVTLQQQQPPPLEKAGVRRPTGRDVMALYCAFQPGLGVKDWMNRMNPRQKHVDERRLVQYGVWQGILRKITGYPVPGNRSLSHLDTSGNSLLQMPEADRASSGGAIPGGRTKMPMGEAGAAGGECKEPIQWALQPDGTHSVEEFAIAHSLTQGDFVRKFEAQGGYIIWK